MTDFLKTPQTPERPVKTALIGDAPDAVLHLLTSRDIELVRLPVNKKLSGVVRTHADANVFHTGDGIFFCDVAMAPMIEALRPRELHLCTVAGGYPTDCALNAAWPGSVVFAHKTALYEELQRFFLSHEITLQPVKQGYARCSVCPVGSRGLLTDDSGIYEAAKRCGLDVLLLEKGDIRLNGHPYGFIGGASAMIAPDKVAFFGDLSTHRNRAEIKAFLQKHDMKYVDIPGLPLTDVGGIVAIR